VSDPKLLVHRLVDEIINGRDLDQLDDVCSRALAPKLRLAFEQFLAAFPDWHQEIVELVAEAERVVARFRCTGTQLGAWQGLAPTGRSMRIDEVYFFRIDDGRLASLWGLEDTWTRLRQLAGDDVTLGELGRCPERARLNPVLPASTGRRASASPGCGRSWSSIGPQLETGGVGRSPADSVGAGQTHNDDCSTWLPNPLGQMTQRWPGTSVPSRVVRTSR